MKFVAIDLGSSFVRAAAVDSSTLQVSPVVRRSTSGMCTTSDQGRHEIDPHRLLNHVRRLVDQIHAENPGCHGILITGQMGGVILCESSGQSVSPYISWQDVRATNQRQGTSSFEELNDRIDDDVRSMLGNELRPGLPIPLLFHLMNVEEISATGLTPCGLPDFIAASLADNAPVTEITNAAGVIDVRKRSYATELLRDLQLDRFDWPQLVSFGQTCGLYESSTGVLSVYAATGDHPCSLVGSLVTPHELSMNIATGSQMSMLTNRVDVGAGQMRPFFDDLWLNTVTNIPAGRALSVVMRLLTEMTGESEPSKEHWAMFFDAADSVSSSDIDVSLAFFPGAIAQPASFNNLTEHNLTLPGLAFACLRQLATQYRDLYPTVCRSEAVERIVFSGGVARRSRLLRHLIEQQLSLPSRLAPTQEDTLLGMAVLGRVVAKESDCVEAAIRFARGLLSVP